MKKRKYNRANLLFGRSAEKKSSGFMIVIIILLLLILGSTTTYFFYFKQNKNDREIHEVLKKEIESKKEEDVDYSINIKNLLKAEDNRNFDKVSQYFATEVIRYWNEHYPTKTLLKKRYLDSWSKMKFSKNYLLSIDKISKNTFNYVVQFDFRSIKNDEEKSVKSKMRIVFNDDGKITELYRLQIIK